MCKREGIDGNWRENTVPASSSLDHSETTLPAWSDTDSQKRLHFGTFPARRVVMTALRQSREPQLQKQYRRIENCCAHPLIGLSGGKPKPILMCCRDRMCPRCQAERGNRCAARVLFITNGFDSIRFVTLTQKSRAGEPLADSIKRLHRSFGKLRQLPAWRHRVKGGTASLEVTRNTKDRTWHCHLHLLVDGEYFDQKQLSKLWLAVTGDSPIVDIRAVHSKKSAADYVARYVAKPAEVERWGNAAICEYALALRGKRMVQTFGHAHGITADEAPEAETAGITETVCSVAKLKSAAALGDERSERALEILSRSGATWRYVLGLPPRSGQEPALPPVEQWEHEIVIACCRRLKLYPGWELREMVRNGRVSQKRRTEILTSLFDPGQ